VHRLEPIARIGKRAAHDGRERIGEITLLERIPQVDLDRRGRRRRGRRSVFGHPPGLARGLSRGKRLRQGARRRRFYFPGDCRGEKAARRRPWEAKLDAPDLAILPVIVLKNPTGTETSMTPFGFIRSSLAYSNPPSKGRTGREAACCSRRPSLMIMVNFWQKVNHHEVVYCRNYNRIDEDRFAVEARTD
jgi:hypothetical protein